MTYKLAITGRFRRGKNTVADMLAQLLPGQTDMLAFADALKAELRAMIYSATSITDDTVLNDKKLHGLGYQWWGEVRRQVSGHDYWIRMLEPDYHTRYHLLEHNVIITDMRHHNEAHWCLSNGFYLIRVEGPPRSLDEHRDPTHPSERDVADLQVDYVIYNVGDIEHLRREVKHMWHVMGGDVS